MVFYRRRRKMTILLKKHWNLLGEVIVRILLLVAFGYLERCPPYVRVIKPEELWLYKNPIKHNTVNTPTLLCVCLFLPCAFIITHYFSTKHLTDLRQGLLGITLTAGLNGVITDLIKLSVGRPRPDFFYRCFPDDHLTSDLLCVGDPDLVEEGRKSFPSGHSSWVFSCFGFLSLYLVGKLQCFRPEGRGQGWRLVLALSPLMAAALVALSRLQDHRHHWDDVLAGTILGLCIGTVGYLHHYYPPWHSHCYLPYSAETVLPKKQEGGGLTIGRGEEEEDPLKFRSSHSMLSLPSQSLTSRTM